MSNSRDKKTNLALSILCDSIDGSEDNIEFPITLVVGGQLITGLIISEKNFYNLESNQALKPIYELIYKEKSEYFNTNGSFKNEDITDEEIDKIPDTLWQRFLYLKDARYMTGNTFVPSENNQGSAIQVRVSDIVAFNFGTFTTAKNDDDA
ncbi:hypothetical protein QDT13_002455 [Acinetobacter baumannii]|uniref:Uncharacterized protein n=1 Tax=Acinetobacter baumannii TaxID=470 RepID=A0A1S2FG77_ACIBA|nr:MULTISPECIES: hypothetical protein [Acinetobacter]EKV3806630.1 hypothetical protein [Acinetobacter baumannii]EKW1172923.1 hypothetical protein [Acinetobacter baumannii]MDC4404039.1 hypothetical protein [Acinetobacter baumannii]MDC5578307.1 hypothetical protein [Acinetobacter baumannii]MDX8161238.1 hypothetical protein [Acinetobacter pittii]